MNATTKTNTTLYSRQQPYPQADRLTLAWLRTQVTQLSPDMATPVWIALEPRAWLPPDSQGHPRAGRIAGLAPLARQLPDAPPELPLLAASLYLANTWHHWHDAQPLSGLPLQHIHWSSQPLDFGQQHTNLIRTDDKALTWQDRARFGLEAETAPAQQPLNVEHFFLNGKRLTWRILP